MPNERLRATLRSNGYTDSAFAEDIGVDAKTVQRWVTKGRTPHPNTAQRAAKLLNVPAPWLWPDLEKNRSGPNSGEVVALYSHRSDTPKHLWMDLLVGAQEHIDLFANASLFLPEDNPEAISIIKHKAANGVAVRILLGDPDHPAMELRGREERLFDALPGRIRMALAYYRPLMGSMVSTFGYTGQPSIIPSFGMITRCWLISTSTARTGIWRPSSISRRWTAPTCSTHT
jgi:transcriptional regulator with XRE-family HTH domain